MKCFGSDTKSGWASPNHVWLSSTPVTVGYRPFSIEDRDLGLGAAGAVFSYAAGTQLYLSPTVAGTYTSTKPVAPDHMVYVGVIERSHVNQGSILVRIQNGYELDELHDVAIASKTNNDLLAYESATNLWKNKSFGTLGLLMLSALVWSACRFYYFLFYVLEKYVNPELRYAGLVAFARGLGSRHPARSPGGRG